MTSSLHIANDFALPLDAVTQTFALLAIRGSGKTYTSAVMVEEMLGASLPVCVVDPVGVWWGLRSNVAGDGPGLPIVVLGGDHGDLPLDVASGAVIADLIVDDGIPSVLDLSLFRKGEQTRFVQDFAERLYHRNRRPLHLVLDEADAFAPQRPMPGQQRMLGAVEDLVRRGRARGIGVTLITQRPAVLNKDVLTQVQVLIALRLVSPQDRKALDAWVEAHGTPEEQAELAASLASLPIGDAWVWSPGWLGVFQRIHIRPRRTFDSSATPKVGETRIEPRMLAEIDLDAIRAKLVAVVEQAQADNPAALRREIAALKHQIKRSGATEPVRIVERVEVPALDIATVDDLRSHLREAREISARMESVGDSIERALSRWQGRDVPVLPAPLSTVRRPVTPPAKPAPPPVAPSTKLRAGARRMLDALVAFRGRPLSRRELGTLAGIVAGGGTFTAYLGDLRAAGWVTVDGTGIEPTDAGIAEIGGRASASYDLADILATWQGELRAGARRMLDELIAAHPRGLTRGELAERSGIEAKGGTFTAYLGDLKRLGLADVEYGEVRASETLFLGAGLTGECTS